MRQDPERYHKRIRKAANDFLRCFGPAFTGTPGGHIQTDIAGAASVAGLMLLRSVFPEVDRVPPGGVVLGSFLDNLYNEQAQMQALMMNLATQMGLQSAGEWHVDIPTEHAPMFETVELTRRLEPAFRRICKNCRVPPDYFPHVAGLTTIKLVAAGQQTRVIDESVGKRIASFYVIAGSRTAPHPLEGNVSVNLVPTKRRFLLRFILVSLVLLSLVYILVRLAPG